MPQLTFDEQLGAVTIEVTSPEWGSGTVKNVHTNPSFESATIPAGTERTTEWAVKGANALRVPETTTESPGVSLWGVTAWGVAPWGE